MQNVPVGPSSTKSQSYHGISVTPQQDFQPRPRQGNVDVREHFNGPRFGGAGQRMQYNQRMSFPQSATNLRLPYNSGSRFAAPNHSGDPGGNFAPQFGTPFDSSYDDDTWYDNETVDENESGRGGGDSVELQSNFEASSAGGDDEGGYWFGYANSMEETESQAKHKQGSVSYHQFMTEGISDTGCEENSTLVQRADKRKAGECLCLIIFLSCLPLRMWRATVIVLWILNWKSQAYRSCPPHCLKIVMSLLPTI